MRFVLLRVKLSRSEETPNVLRYIRSHNMPICLIKGRRKTIGSWSFPSIDRPYRHLYFRITRYHNQHVIHLRCNLLREEALQLSKGLITIRGKYLGEVVRNHPSYVLLLINNSALLVFNNWDRINGSPGPSGCMKETRIAVSLLKPLYPAALLPE